LDEAVNDHLGPIDYLVVEFPDNRMTGDGLRTLVDLVDRGLIRVLDLIFVRKDGHGATTVLAVSDLDGGDGFDLAMFEGVASGLLLKDDIDEAGAVLNAGSSAAVMIYENRWAAPMVAALRRGGAECVASGRIPLSEVAELLDTT
jgi:hypothetical protein